MQCRYMAVPICLLLLFFFFFFFFFFFLGGGVGGGGKGVVCLRELNAHANGN